MIDILDTVACGIVGDMGKCPAASRAVMTDALNEMFKSDRRLKDAAKRLPAVALLAGLGMWGMHLSAVWKYNARLLAAQVQAQTAQVEETKRASQRNGFTPPASQPPAAPGKADTIVTPIGDLTPEELQAETQRRLARAFAPE
jgi:glycerol-3-phosphate dehydrogenase